MSSDAHWIAFEEAEERVRLSYLLDHEFEPERQRQV
jgi:hypothetical protein